MKLTEEIARNASNLARNARIETLKMTSRAKASHVGSALSVIDILSVIYSGVANISPRNANDPKRDIVILSKGHSAAAIYSILSLKEFFPSSHLDQYCMNGALLGGHATSSGVNGLELSTGSLGHGFPYGLGIALSRLRTNSQGRVFIVMSDGECDEGTTWESALIANHHNLSNLIVIIDRNRIQSLKDTESTLKLEPFELKWKAFGFDVETVNGHDYESLATSMLKPQKKPRVIVANTTKGKGVAFMEDTVLWHYRSLNEAELEEAIKEVENKL